MRKKTALLLCLTVLCLTVSFVRTEIMDAGSELEELLSFYTGKEFILSEQLQIVQNHVNFRKTPGGEVLGRLQGGMVLDCLDETQHQGELWYHARSAEFGDGYVISTFAKPVWNHLNYWPLSDSEDVITDNMILFAYWMGTYQIDYGLSTVENAGNEKQISIAPLTVRGNLSMIPDDMRILLATKLFEYGFICKNPAYDQLLDDSLSFMEKDQTASSVLNKHYGTDDIWQIIVSQSAILWIQKNDLHARPEGPFSERDHRMMYAVRQKVIGEH